MRPAVKFAEWAEHVKSGSARVLSASEDSAVVEAAPSESGGWPLSDSLLS